MSINKARVGCGTGVGHNISGSCVASTCCVLHLVLAAGKDQFSAAQPGYSTLRLPQADPTSLNLAATLRARVNVCYWGRGNVIDKFYDTQMTIGHTSVPGPILDLFDRFRASQSLIHCEIQV